TVKGGAGTDTYSFFDGWGSDALGGEFTSGVPSVLDVRVPEDTGVTIPSLGDLTQSGDTLVEAPEHGAVRFNDDGSVVYSPEPQFSGQDHFSYQVKVISTSTFPETIPVDVQIHLMPVADERIADFDFASGDEGSAIPLDISATLPDQDG